MTLDGCMAASTGHSKWITGELARKDVMYWRRLFPAIAVTQNTVSSDNPMLTSRLGDEVSCSQRFVFNRELRDLETTKTTICFRTSFGQKRSLFMELKRLGIVLKHSKEWALKHGK